MQPLVTSRLVATLSLLAGLQLALFVTYFFFAIIVTPYGDVLDWLTQYYNFQYPDLWQYLWAPHNGHRIIFTKLLTIGDAELFGGLSYPIALICLSLWLLTTAIAIFAIRREIANPSTRHWITVMMVLLLFPTYNLANYAYPVNSGFVIACSFVFASCVLIAQTAFLKSDSKLQRNAYFILSLIAGGCASLSSLNGIIIWPILMWAAWALNLGRIYIVILAAMGGLFAFMLGYHQSVQSGAEQAIIGPGDIVHILKYLVEYHGMPWVEVRLIYWPFMVIGAALFSLSIVFSFKGVLHSRTLTPHAVVAVAMLLFALGTAVMIAIGRHELGLLPAHRYGIFLLITCASLLVLNTSMVDRWTRNAHSHAILLRVTLIFAVGYVGQQVMVGQFAVQRAKNFAQYEKDIMAGKDGPLARQAIYFADVDKIEQYYQLLEKQQIYMFRPGDE